MPAVSGQSTAPTDSSELIPRRMPRWRRCRVWSAPVVGEGAVWVPSAIAANALFRVDLATGAVTRIATGPSNDEWPITAAVTPGAVWVGNHHGGTVARVDPRTNAVVASIAWASTPTAHLTHGHQRLEDLGHRLPLLGRRRDRSHNELRRPPDAGADRYLRRHRRRRVGGLGRERMAFSTRGTSQPTRRSTTLISTRRSAT